jgi:hypothetical protein
MNGIRRTVGVLDVPTLGQAATSEQGADPDVGPRTLLGVSDYESLVELAAKGMAERDNHPMPPSVTTPEAFYEIMAGAALDAVGFRTLLERVGQAERELEAIQESSRRADADAGGARHRRAERDG